MAVTSSIQYGSKGTLTWTEASLATSATLVAGRESTAVSNATDLAIDVMVGGIVMVGTTPTANMTIQIYCYASYDNTNFSGSATGTDAALTPSAKELMRLLIAIPSIATTSNLAHKYGPYFLSQVFGAVPIQWGLWLTHNTVAALNATGGNHEAEYYPIKYTSA